MTSKLNGVTRTKQNTKQYLLNKHQDIFAQDFINQCYNNEFRQNVINKQTCNYFVQNIGVFNNLQNDVDYLLRNTIEIFLQSLGFEKNKDYTLVNDYKIKTTPIISAKLLSAYNYDVELASMLQNVLLY